MKSILLLSAVMLFSGCAAIQKNTQDNYDRRIQQQEQEEQEKKRIEAQLTDKERQERKDTIACRYDVTKATASGQRGYTVYSTIFNSVGDTFRQVELMQLCMEAKGYKT